MKTRLTRLLLEVTVMLLGGVSKSGIKELENALGGSPEGCCPVDGACAASKKGCLSGKSEWVVRTCVWMVKARKMVNGEF